VAVNAVVDVEWLVARKVVATKVTTKTQYGNPMFSREEAIIHSFIHSFGADE
jgi:hypothetical protein